MAQIARTFDLLKSHGDRDCHVITWSPLTFSGLDEGIPIEMPGSADRSVQITGISGVGFSIRIEGSNLPAPSLSAIDWAPLTDPQGNDLNIATLKIEAISELTRWIRPRITAGDGTTSVTVSLLLRRQLT